MSQRWYVATTKPNGELLAARDLRKQKFGVYLPKVYEPQEDGRKVHPVALLRFPGYVFVAFDKALQQHGPINNTRGVGQLLVDGAGDPEPMYPGIIDKLRALEDEDFDKARTSADLKERTDLVPGDEVLVDAKEHVLYGQKGFYMGHAKGEANVLIGMAVWKDISTFDLKKVEKPKKPKAEKPKKKRRKKGGA